MIHVIALIFGIILPFWNIPLVVRIMKRKSSEDISIFWALGVWTCLLFMAPSAFISTDFVWRVFSIVNLVIFSFVVAVVLFYRNKKKR
ncbi:MAG: hypothetical protein Q8N91_01615 [Candidatus Omnitrophota bacterium]|nr:hypothetical protein [Candidatus Omnitrophota bacterium]